MSQRTLDILGWATLAAAVGVYGILFKGPRVRLP